MQKNILSSRAKLTIQGGDLRVCAPPVIAPAYNRLIVNIFTVIEREYYLIIVGLIINKIVRYLDYMNISIPCLCLSFHYKEIY